MWKRRERELVTGAPLEIPSMIFVWIEVAGDYNAVSKLPAGQSMLSFLTFSRTSKLNKYLNTR